MHEAELLAHDHWTRDRILTYQQDRVRALLTHAVTRSPYYREVLGADARDDLPERLRGILVAAIASTGAVPPNVEVHPVSTLKREPGGKIPMVRWA